MPTFLSGRSFLDRIKHHAKEAGIDVERFGPFMDTQLF